MYDLDTHHVFVNRDVKFFEHVFPFRNIFLHSYSDLHNSGSNPPLFLNNNSSFLESFPAPTAHIGESSIDPVVPSSFQQLDSISSPNSLSIPLQQSTRISKTPQWLLDFVHMIQNNNFACQCYHLHRNIPCFLLTLLHFIQKIMWLL